MESGNNSSRFGRLGLIIANSHPKLGREVADCLGITPLEVESREFPNEELDVRRLSDVSGLDICVFSSLHAGYDTLKELRLLVSSVRGSASRVFGVFPFVRDGKSDHLKRFGETMAYKDTALQISSSGLEVIAIFDQHSSQHPGFFDTTGRLRMVHHIYLMKLLIEHAKMQGIYDGVLALDDGGFKRNKKVAELLGLGVSFIIKERDAATRQISIERSRIVGNVKGQRVAAFDDMLQGGGTLEAGARIAKHNDAKEVSFFVVHPDFTSETLGRINPLLEEGVIDKVYTLGTLPIRDQEKWHKNLVVLSPARMIANVIDRIHTEGHMRDLFLEI